MLKMSLGQFFVHIYGLKVKKVHGSVVNFARSLSAEAQLGPPFCQLWLLFGHFVQRLHFDKISGRKQRLVLDCVFVLNVELCHLTSMDAVCAVAGPDLDVPLEVVAGERTVWTSFLKVLPLSPGQWETKDRMTW